ncbi:single-stranded DNA-binding protein [Human betaherpesvirus 5]|uniref:Single-stranded DNA-binding protein n=1 Tax=Human cytomegalovirus TaxID=10359 RepID=A0A0G2THE4_HCMV|nr:single-stranded DNA-binding protein [Human betaherpesvirus 5]AKI10632.1 single-stranded DNA-binding protein [Human betaherpesvirus 5]AKI20153.1 single-stranded DNA-binding protein [Human betaherpesvirus 5]APG57257.1 single-stranded DNA-binding protein [Human betaherpesvirus 5]AQN71024.1 single-stranded DNA-binding protein [Human betaherpesvirus 5]
MSHEELTALAPVGPAAFLYFSRLNAETQEILATLSLCDRSSSVVIAPLLAGLTVEADFGVSVRTPVLCYDGGVLTKVTSFCPFALYFHHTQGIVAFTEDHGDVHRLCEDARQKYALEAYTPEADRVPTDLAALCAAVGCQASETTVHVVVGNGLKEFLFAGQLIPCVEEATTVRLHGGEAVRVPLYPPTLFNSLQLDAEADEVSLDARSAFVEARGLYVPAVSETLFYYVYTSWCQSLRFSEPRVLIEAALRQFVHDSQQSVKLAPHKRYLGYMSQRLSSLEKDHLMLSDAVVCELAFSFASVFFDSAYQPAESMLFSEWPLVTNATDHRDLIRALTELKLHLSTHVAALVFSANSVLYQHRLVYLQSSARHPSAGGTASQETLLKAIQFTNGLSAACEDVYNDARKVLKFQGAPLKDERYGPQHLALVCGTCPQLVSGFVWYLNRVSVYNTGLSGSSTLTNHLVGCAAGLCEACGGTCCHTCYQTAFVRVRTRLPVVPKQPKKEPCVITVQSRFLNDVDILGSFGRRYNVDAKDGGLDGKGDDGVPGGGAGGGGGRDVSGGPSDGLGGGRGGGGGGDSGGMMGRGGRMLGASVDRTYRLNRILDYCRKMRLIDPVTGEDTFSAHGKSDFVAVFSALNKFVDDEALGFVSEVRLKSSRDEVAGATQAFNLDLNPYAVAFQPLLAYAYFRSVFYVIQNVALITATSYIVDNPLTTNLVSKWMTQHFQSIHGAFSTTSSRKGFLFTKQIKSSKNSDHDRLLDFRLYAQGTYAVVPMEIKLSRLSVPTLIMVRVKNRPIYRAGKGNAGSVFFRRDHVPRRNPAKGCLGFLLYRHHERLFPECGLPCLQFWQKVCSNALPKNVPIGDMGEFNAFVKFLVAVTADYQEHDLLDVAPDCVLSYVESRFHNKFLCYYGFKDYIGSLHGLTTRLTTQNHAQFPHVLGASPRFSSPAEFALHVKGLKTAGVPAPMAATVARESLVRSVFEHRSLVTVPVSVEKYAGINNSKEIYQFGQIGYFSGNGVERSLNVSSMSGQDYRFMRQRYLLATRLADVLIKRSRRENVLFDADLIKNRVMLALDAENLDCDPEVMAVYEILSVREEIPASDDVLFFVDGCEALAASLMDKFAALQEQGVEDFSLDNLRRVLDADAQRLTDAAGGEVHDLSALFAPSGVGAASGVGGGGLLLGESVAGNSICFGVPGETGGGCFLVNAGEDEAGGVGGSSGGGGGSGLLPAKRSRL